MLLHWGWSFKCCFTGDRAFSVALLEVELFSVALLEVELFSVALLEVELFSVALLEMELLVLLYWRWSF